MTGDSLPFSWLAAMVYGLPAGINAASYWAPPLSGSAGPQDDAAAAVVSAASAAHAAPATAAPAAPAADVPGGTSLTVTQVLEVTTGNAKFSRAQQSSIKRAAEGGGGGDSKRRAEDAIVEAAAAIRDAARRAAPAADQRIAHLRELVR